MTPGAYWRNKQTKYVCVIREHTPTLVAYEFTDSRSNKGSYWLAPDEFSRRFEPYREPVSDPKVIVGRFASRPDVEWSVAIGCRVVFDAPTGYTFDVVALSDAVVTLKNVSVPIAGFYYVGCASFFATYKPAPRESRWLDPASVPVGKRYLHCWNGPYCPYPATNGGVSMCPACCDRGHAKTPVLNPSALTPAPRWKHKPPRVRHTNFAYIRCGDQEDEGSNFVFHAPRKNSLVRKVSTRYLDTPIVDPGNLKSRWVLA